MSEHDPVCAYCGGSMPAMEALIYHGVVYHPACVEPTTRRSPSAPRRAQMPSPPAPSPDPGRALSQ